MHENEVRATPELVERLVADQCPQWSGLPVTALPDDVEGTDNVLFRLGDELVVRMPKIEWAQDQAESDARWLPRLGEETTAAAFAGFRAGAGRDGPSGGVSVSVHDSDQAAADYVSALLALYEGSPHEGLRVTVFGEGRVVASAVNPSAETAEREARRALAAAR